VEVLDYPDDAQQFGARARQLTDGKGVPAVYDGVDKSTFDASLASLAARRGRISCAPATSSPGAQANCSTRSPAAPSPLP
jgi:NADPH:quinone reductase